MTRLENALQDAEIRMLIVECFCPCDLESMSSVDCPAGVEYPGINRCETCWTTEYTEKDCARKGD